MLCLCTLSKILKMKIIISLCFSLLFFNCEYQAPNNIQANHQPFTLDGKIAISEDNGKNWKSLDHQIIDTSEIFSYSVDNNQLLIGTSNARLIKINLEDASLNITENVMEAMINKKPIEQNRVFGVFPCPSGLYSFVNGGGIFRKSPNSNYWQPVSPPDGIHGISKIIEDDDSNLFMACQYGLYKSSDFGNNWTRVFTIGFANDVVIIDKTIYVTGINGIHCSIDGGNTWQQFTKLQEKIGVNKNQNISIFSHSNRLYVFIQTHDSLLPNTEVNELLYSDDHGSTCHEHDMEKFLNSMNDVQNISMYDDKIFVSTKYSLLMTMDHGKTWQEIISVPKNQTNKTLRSIFVKDKWIVIKENSGC